jgi:nicotinate-nucleotide adenylyltransferase
MTRLGILGGTFDPIHFGHLVIAEDARVYLGLAKVLFVPAFCPPHKTHRAYSTFDHRVRMVELGIQGNRHFEVSLVESERPGLSYTVDTLRELQSRLGQGTELFFIMGMDSLANLTSWYKPVELLNLCRLVVAERAGYQADLAALEKAIPKLRQRLELIDTPELSISSTDLQRRVMFGLSIRYQVPPSVEKYIRANRLYPDEAPHTPKQTVVSSETCGKDER